MNEPWLTVDTAKIYFVTDVNDDSKIVTCFLSENKKELLVKDNTYILREIRSWTHADQVCIQCDQETKVTSVQSNLT